MAKFPKSAELLAVQRTPTVVHFEILGSDASQTFTIPVKAGTIVHLAGVQVSTQFTSASSLVVGGATFDLDAATGTTVSVSAAQYFAADGNLNLVLTNGGSAGVVKGFVVMSNVKLDGIAE